MIRDTKIICTDYICTCKSIDDARKPRILYHVQLQWFSFCGQGKNVYDSDWFTITMYFNSYFKSRLVFSLQCFNFSWVWSDILSNCAKSEFLDLQPIDSVNGKEWALNLLHSFPSDS